MAANTGLAAVTAGGNVQADLLAHLYPTGVAVATAVTITGPVRVALVVGATDSTNTTMGTECTDANYARQSITVWNAPTTTAGGGSAAGYTAKTSTNALTFGGAGGFAATQSIRGNFIVSSDATPVIISYQNLPAVSTILVNQVYTVAAGQAQVQIG